MNRFFLVVAVLVAGCSDPATPVLNVCYPDDELCSPLPVEVAGDHVFDQVAAGGSHACGLVGTAAYCWGSNTSGQLGVQTTGTACDGLACARSPVAVQGGVAFVSLALGDVHSCGLTVDGTAYCWGAGGGGRLGTGSTAGSATPTAVAGTYTQLAAGREHTCALDTAGQAFCWGLNQYASLGNGDVALADQSTPVAVADGHTFETIRAGGYHNCAIEAGTGTTWCWGLGDSGQLGTTAQLGFCTQLMCSNVPVAVSGDLSILELGLGTAHSCGVVGTGLTYCWGEGEQGQLGTGDFLVAFEPVLVVGGVEFASLAGGLAHTCATTADDYGYCWGRNERGQIGGSTAEARLVPGLLSSSYRFSSITTGRGHTCATSTDASTYCWGDDARGQLGDG